LKILENYAMATGKNRRTGRQKVTLLISKGKWPVKKFEISPSIDINRPMTTYATVRNALAAPQEVPSLKLYHVWSSNAIDRCRILANAPAFLLA
jgi:hypothetical protein